MRKIALVNQKGGVGKTTTAVNLAAALSRLDRKVLLIDLDPQSNATISLGVPAHELHCTSYALLTGKPVEPLWLEKNLALIPSNIELSGAEMELAGVIGRETILRDSLTNIEGFDFILLDCSPSLGLLSVNALTFAEEVIVPLQCEFLALHGISLLSRTIDLVQKRLNPALRLSGVVPCMYDVRNRLARETVEEIESYFKERVYKTRIRTNVRLAEAPSHGKSIFEYAPESKGAEDYYLLAREVAGIQDIVRDPEPLPVLEQVDPETAPPPLIEQVEEEVAQAAEAPAAAPPPLIEEPDDLEEILEIPVAPETETDIQSAP